MSRKILSLYFLISMITGCASTGSYTANGEVVSNVHESLPRGEVRLTCNTACSGTWGSKREEMKALYENELWNDLASVVSDLGFRSDQTYYYLGQSAEGLGYKDAARTYYKLAKSSYKCDGSTFNNCDGLVFPLLLDERLKALGPPKAAAALPAQSVESSASGLIDIDDVNSETSNSSIKQSSSYKDNNLALATPAKKSPAIKEVSVFKDVEYKSQTDLLEDIKALKSINVTKKPLETSEEYQSRIRDVKLKYRGREYQVVLPIQNIENKTYGLAYFNPDTNTLKISLPNKELMIAEVYIGGEWTYKGYSISYVGLSRSDTRGSSGFETSGIAFITPVDPTYSDPVQLFTINTDRESAKRILRKGKIRMRVMIDPSLIADGASSLVLQTDSKIMFPARLVNISLLDENDAVVYQMDGDNVFN